VFSLITLFFEVESWISILKMILAVALTVNLFTMITELTMTHPSTSAQTVVKMITKGRYKYIFWIRVVLVENIILLTLLIFTPNLIIVASAIILHGIYFTEKIWIEAPQRIPLA